MNRKTTLLLSLSIILVVTLLFFDNNCFLKKPVSLAIFEKKVEESSSYKSISSTHRTFFLKDSLGHKYKVSGGLYNFSRIGDSILVTRSLLLNRAIRIDVLKQDEYAREDIGVLNADWFSKLMCVIPFALSLNILVFGSYIKEIRVAGSLIISGIVTATIIAFYFIFST